MILKHDMNYFITGIVSGLIGLALFNMSIAIITAFISGIMGIAGKELFIYAKRKFFQRNNKKDKK